MLENTLQGSAQEKVGGKWQELLILNLVLMYQLLCLFRVIQLSSTWKYHTLLNLLLLQVIIQFLQIVRGHFHFFVQNLPYKNEFNLHEDEHILVGKHISVWMVSHKDYSGWLK